MGGPLCNSAAPGQSIRDQNSLQLQIVWSSALGMMMHQQKEEVQWRELEWLELKLQRTNQQPSKGRTRERVDRGSKVILLHSCCHSSFAVDC